MVAILMIEVRELHFTYPVQHRAALDGIDLDIAAGTVTWFTGRLGSGTSTLLLALAGLAPRLTGGAGKGTVRVHGCDPAAAPPLSSGIAYLGASPGLQLSGIAPSVRQEIAIGPMNLGVASALEAADRAMHRFDLAHLAARAPGKLSGGETQRLMLAALFATAPVVWLLDEPFSALDNATRIQMATLLRTLADDGATVVIASDDADTMSRIADRMVVLTGGRVILDGPPHDLLAGDPILAAGAGTTDSGVLAHLGGIEAPRPITVTGLLEHLHAVVAAAPPVIVRSHARHGEEVLHFERVSFRYSKASPVLRDVTVSVHAGEAVGVLGANGAGKSTLLRLGMALEHPVEGVVRTLARSTTGRHPEDLAPRAGFLFQQPERQLFATSVRDECRFGPRLAGWSALAIDEATNRILDMLGLAHLADEHPGDLPLPTRRLVGLATVLVTDPVLLLLDEPTAGLDPDARNRVIGAVRQRTLRGRATVAVTHDPVFAHEALDRAVLVADGMVTDLGAMDAAMDDSLLPPPAALMVARALRLTTGTRRDVVAAAIAARSGR